MHRLDHRDDVPGGNAAGHVGEGLGTARAGLAVGGGAQREGAPDEGEQPNQADQGEDGRQQRVVAGAARAITEARRTPAVPRSRTGFRPPPRATTARPP